MTCVLSSSEFAIGFAAGISWCIGTASMVDGLSESVLPRALQANQSGFSRVIVIL